MHIEDKIHLTINSEDGTEKPTEISLSRSDFNTLLSIGAEYTTSKNLEKILTCAIEHILENEILNRKI